ncbi:GNAT family protein [uncultured Agrococcus sp.]|uniref:GNAT family N-acetyltransferase n=1 Tax=uncultured Agrococcus sp. TaxID=382258 RepID=UPI0025EDA5AC|nr:GNAT family protein [uncultured Agrococcus sp.]
MPTLRNIDLDRDTAAVLAAFDAADDDLLRQASAIDSAETAREYLETMAGLGWAIDESGTLIGIVSAASRSAQHKSAWMSYWLEPGVRGRGIAARALATASDVLFADGFHRLELGARTNNPASIKTAERAGYVHEGVNREELEYDGVRFDTVRMARLSTDPAPSITLLRMI